MLVTVSYPADLFSEIEHTLDTVESVREKARAAQFYVASARLSEVIDSIVDLKIDLEEAENERS